MNPRTAARTLAASSPNSSRPVPCPPPGTTSRRLWCTLAARYITRACSVKCWSSAATTNSTGTRSRAIAPWASTPLNPEGPDRLTTPATGGRIRVAADSTAVPPIEEPTSTTRSTPRRRSCSTAATTSVSTRSSPDPCEVEGQHLVAVPGERPRLGDPLAQIAVELVADHQPLAPVPQDQPD